MKRFKISYLVGIIAVAVLGCACVAAVIYQNATSVTTDVEQMLSRAEYFYGKGDVGNAVYQLQLYCSEKPESPEGYMLLGDIYSDEGSEDKALEYYKKAASKTETADNSASESKKSVKLSENYSDAVLKITPTARYTKNMKLTVSGENLTPETVKGKINGTDEELETDDGCLTTEWFSLDGSEDSLVLSGGINCALWQFKDEDGAITVYTDKNSIRLLSNVRFTTNEAVSKADIPLDAVSARVTYYDASLSETTCGSGDIMITYGNDIGGYTDITAVTLDIPDLAEGEYIEYSNGVWTLYSDGGSQELDLGKISISKGAYISVSGDLSGTVEVSGTAAKTEKGDKSKIYGIKYSTESGVTSCARVGDAKGMTFDYTVGDEWAGDGVNDFDNAYPWCDMKLCTVKSEDGETKVTYSDDENFKTDGTSGNVMVEIPKFYVSRTVSDGYEQICISGTKHDGYTVDPVFIDEDGNELDKVYVSAYLGCESDEKIVSTSSSYPTVLLTYEDTLEYAENNGEGFSEMNYLMVSALQKLFVIETGVIDSSELFAGDTFMYYYYESSSVINSGTAAEDAENSNTVTVYKNSGTSKLYEGSSIVLFTGWDSYSNSETPHREITKIETLDGDETCEKGYYRITFDGDPVNITKDKTVISNVPAKTGKTDSIEYCTGTAEGEDGKVSFKYRNIENLYGSACIMLDDDAYMCDGRFYFTVGDEEIELNAEIAEQADSLADYSKANTYYCVKKMTYDEDNPTVMIPSETGGDASSFNFYGDFWQYRNTDNDDGMYKYLLYGGADDNARLAGIFQLRAIITYDTTKMAFYSARIMYR